MQYFSLFVCMIGTAMAVHIQPPPTTTRRGSRPAKKTSSWATQSMYPQLSAISHSPIRSIIKTPVKPAFGMKMFAPTSKRARKGFSGFKRGAPRRFRPAVGVAKRTKSKGEMFGRMGMMRVMLPMIMANEGEGLMVLFLAQMMDVRKTSPFLKLHILSGRLGEEAQILGRCVFLMRMPKEQCVLMMLMNP